MSTLYSIAVREAHFLGRNYLMNTNHFGSMGSWTSEAQRSLADIRDHFNDGTFDDGHRFLYETKSVIEALSYLQMGAGHYPSVKDEIDEMAQEAVEIMSRLSSWETMEEREAPPEEAVSDLEDLVRRALDTSMEYRDSDFNLESIRR
ncbi:hypothetical protein [Halobacterium wangiae]|uniref:hypothetical protein n=1 Tax=Halobacterium wangiae TaxID=2902623 RepID=UPI001E5AB687|nr:hypothetical protein [Halobacterium wangiae]